MNKLAVFFLVLHYEMFLYRIKKEFLICSFADFCRMVFFFVVFLCLNRKVLF